VDRQVVLLLAVMVLAVLGLAALSGFVKPLDDLLGNSPIVIVGLVVVTAGVLVLALRPRPGR
jgi:FtsH-binding integral membrane protein